MKSANYVALYHPILLLHVGQNRKKMSKFSAIVRTERFMKVVVYKTSKADVACYIRFQDPSRNLHSHCIYNTNGPLLPRLTQIYEIP